MKDTETGPADEAVTQQLRAVAHALNNVFAVIQLSAAMAMDGLAEGKSPEGEVREIQDAVARGRELLIGLAAMYKSPLESEPGPGAGPHPQVRTASAALGGEEAGRGKRILFVDDEVELAQLGQRLLIKKGYEVAFFTDSQAAFQVFATDPQGFDLVVTDQNMPGLNGIELAGRILQIRPEVPILLCTGYSTGFSRWNFRDHGFRELLVKPYQPTELLSAVRSLLVRAAG